MSDNIAIEFAGLASREREKVRESQLGTQQPRCNLAMGLWWLEAVPLIQRMHALRTAPPRLWKAR